MATHVVRHIAGATRSGPHRVGLILAAAMLLASSARAEDPAPPPNAPAFQPGEISIGEPIPLPFRGPDGSGEKAGIGGAATPVDDPRSAVPPTPAAAASVPGSGWLGLAVAPSTVPGRWRIEEVTPGGPAARAGILAGDELRAVNGSTLTSPEEVSQALTVIAAGQDVKVAVARADRVSDVVLRAESRPPPRPVEPSRFATEPPAIPARSPGSDAAEPALGPSATPEWRPATAAVPDAPRPTPRADVDPGPAADLPAPVVARTGGASEPLAPASDSPAAPGRVALGVRTVPIDPALQTRFNLTEPTGAYVIGVVQDLPAARAGVPPGSVIVALGGQAVRSPLELTRLVTSGPLDRPVTVRFVLPGGEEKRADVMLQSLDAPLERALTGGVRPVEPPVLQPGPVPRRAERIGPMDDAIRAEIRGLRDRLDHLERLLDSAQRRQP